MTLRSRLPVQRTVAAFLTLVITVNGPGDLLAASAIRVSSFQPPSVSWEAFAARAVWSEHFYGRTDAAIKHEIEGHSVLLPATPRFPELRATIEILRRERNAAQKRGGSLHRHLSLEFKYRLNSLIGAQVPLVDVFAFIVPVLHAFNERAQIRRFGFSRLDAVEMGLAAVVAEAFESFILSHKKVLRLPQFKWRRATPKDLKQLTELFALIIQAIEVPYNLIEMNAPEEAIMDAQRAAFFIALRLFKLNNLLSLVSNGQLVPATPYEIQQRVEGLQNMSNYNFAADLAGLSALENDLHNAGISVNERLALFERLLATRLTLRSRFSNVIEFPIAFLEWSIAACYQSQGADKLAHQHLQKALDGMQKQRRFLVPKSWPLWYRLSTALHRMHGELLHNRWSREGKEDDLRAAVKEMRLSYADLSAAASMLLNDEEKIAVPSLLAFYLAELCAYGPTNKNPLYLDEAEKFIRIAQNAVPADPSLHHEIPIFQIELAQGLVHMMRGKIDLAELAFQRSWEMHHSDEAATRLMAIGIENNHLKEARIWSGRVRDKNDYYYCYIRGDLEAVSAEETDGEQSREQWKQAVWYWNKLPAQNRDPLIISFDALPRFHFRVVEASTRGGDIDGAIRHIGDVLAHYRQGLKPLARTLVDGFPEPTHYMSWIREMASLPEKLQAEELVSRVAEELRKKDYVAGTLEDAALQIIGQFPGYLTAARMSEYTAEWKRLLQDKRFDGSLFDRFLTSLRSRTTADLRGALLSAWAEDVTNDFPVEKRAVLAGSYAYVSRYVKELRRLIDVETLSNDARKGVQTVVSHWLTDRRPWITQLMNKAKKYDLISELTYIDKVRSALDSAA